VPVTALLEIKMAAFLLALCRVGGFCLSAPLFGGKGLPIAVKICFSCVLALFFISRVNVPEEIFNSPGRLAIGVAGELLVGIALGFLVQLLFMGVMTAGHILDMQMGIMVGSIFNPSLEMQEPLMGRFHHLLALLLFLALNAHHWLIRGLARSFSILPPMGMQITGAFTRDVSQITAEMFVIALKVGAPIILVLFLADLGLAILSRAMPQLNVFFVAIPAKLLLGFLVTAMALPAAIFLLSGEMRDWIARAVISLSHMH